MSHYPLDEPLRSIDTFYLGSQGFNQFVSTERRWPHISICCRFATPCQCDSYRLVMVSLHFFNALVLCFNFVTALGFSYFISPPPTVNLEWGDGVWKGEAILSHPFSISRWWKRFFNTRPNNYLCIRQRLVSAESGKGERGSFGDWECLRVNFIGKRTGSLRSAGC